MSVEVNRLAIYGSLGPGKPNHHHVSMMQASWQVGYVRGYLRQEGWGAQLGFPGIVLDENAPEIEVEVLESLELPDHLARLDEFEGPGYRREIANIHSAGGDFPAFIYVLAQ